MALTGKVIEQGTGADKKQVFQAEFTNGTFEQLKEILAFLKGEGLVSSDDPTDALRTAISFLLTAKESKEKENSK